MKVGRHDIMSFYEEDLIDLRMSVDIFLNNDSYLETTADELAYNLTLKIIEPYQKLYNVSDRLVMGFASQDVGPQSYLLHFALLSESHVRDAENTNDLINRLVRYVFNQDVGSLRRPDYILLGLYDDGPRIFLISRANNYREAHEIINDHACIGYLEGIERTYDNIKLTSHDIALELIQDRCNVTNGMIGGIPRRYMIDKNGVVEVKFTIPIEPEYSEDMIKEDKPANNLTKQEFFKVLKKVSRKKTKNS